MRVTIFILHYLIFLGNVFSQDASLKVLSYNIRYPNTGDGIHYWDNRKPLVVGMLRFYEPDIIGIQEAHRRQLDELVDHLPEYAWHGVARTDGTMHPNPDNEFSAILYRKDRLELIKGNTFWLSESPDQVGSKGWDAALPRIATWAKFKDKASKHEFYLFNTHFDHIGLLARKESADLLVRMIKKIAGKNPVIVTGDFNSNEKENTYLSLTGYMCTDYEQTHNSLTGLNAEDYLKDAMYNSRSPHFGPLSTFAGNFQVSGLTGPRIDYIFYKNNVEILKHAILSETYTVHTINADGSPQIFTGVFASDHLPVFAEVIIH